MELVLVVRPIWTLEAVSGEPAETHPEHHLYLSCRPRGDQASQNGAPRAALARAQDAVDVVTADGLLRDVDAPRRRSGCAGASEGTAGRAAHGSRLEQAYRTLEPKARLTR
jgi:hypothetical protein